MSWRCARFDDLPFAHCTGHCIARTSRLMLSGASSDLISVETSSSSESPWTCVSTRFRDRKSTRLNSSHGYISYAVFCLKKKKKITQWSKEVSAYAHGDGFTY